MMTTTERPPRDDPSISLLSSLTSSALDPDYELVARRRSASGLDGEPTPARKRLIAGVLLLLIGVLLIGGAVSLRQSRTGSDQQRRELRQRVIDQVAITDAKSARIIALRQELTRLTSEGRSSAAAGGVAALSEIVGASAVEGPGVRVVLQDATKVAPSASTDPLLGKVLDVDLQTAVNGLWAAGAEAVAVNGQRITSLSAIRSAGEAILVNYRPLAPPYIVEGIGDPKTLQARFVDGAAGQALQEAESGYGLRVDVSTQERLSLPAAPTSLRTARTPAPGKGRS